MSCFKVAKKKKKKKKKKKMSVDIYTNHISIPPV